MDKKESQKFFDNINAILSENPKENKRAYDRLKPIVDKKQQEFIAKITAVVEVKFEGSDKPYYFNNRFTTVRPGQRVLVDTKHGKVVARVTDFKSKDEFEPGHPTKDVIKKLRFRPCDRLK